MAEHGVPDTALRVVSDAWLPDHDPVFHYHSGSRGGGALDVVPRLGGAVPGGLFEVDDDAWGALDHKEGAAGQGRYARHDVTVLTSDGRPHEAVTYRVTPSHVQANFVAPAPGYLELARSGLAAFGQSTAQLEAVGLGRPAPALVREVFVYGTLLSGESREHAMRTPGLEGLEPASMTGRLLNLGAYPGLVLDGGGAVEGELWRYPHPSAVLADLDAIEDFLGYGVAGSMYRRALVRAQGRGEARLAWTYVLMDAGAYPVIEGGSWRRR